jgi:two-component system OmpR family response regulator
MKEHEQVPTQTSGSRRSHRPRLETVTPESTGPLRQLRIGVVSLDLDGIQLRISENKVQLSLSEFALLKTLMLNAGRVVSRRELLNAMWGTNYPDKYHQLAEVVRRVRDRFGQHGVSRNLIRTVHGIGHVFEWTDHPTTQ